MAVRAQGLNWAPIQQAHFPTKTPNACRKRHERLMERRSAEDWDSVKLEALAKEYMNIRKEMWSMLASRVGEKWQVVEGKCMEKGIKNLQSSARSALRRERLMTGTGTGTDDSGIAEMDAETELDGEEDSPESQKRHGEEHESEQKKARTNSGGPTIASIVHATSQP